MDNKNGIDIKNLNSLISMFKKVSFYFLIFLYLIAAFTFFQLVKETKVFTFIIELIKVISPLFLGFVIAWLLNPSVKYLSKKKVPRKLSVLIVFAAFIAIISILVSSLIPLLVSQFNALAKEAPSFISKLDAFISDLNINFNLSESVNDFIVNFSKDIPRLLTDVITGLFDQVKFFLISLLISFYLLYNYKEIDHKLISFIPNDINQKISKYLTTINKVLFTYIKGVGLIAFIVFIFSTIALLIIGVEFPILLGFICGLTNIIPYIGPWIGGSFALLVGFNQSVPTGLLVILMITIIQTLESMILQPLVMGKSMELSPVVILLGLFVFGSLFGIIGMIIATPTIAVIKASYFFFKKNIIKTAN